MKTIFAVAAGVLAASCAPLSAFAQDAAGATPNNYVALGVGVGLGDTIGPLATVAYGRRIGSVALEGEAIGLAAFSPGESDYDSLAAGVVNVVFGGQGTGRARPYAAIGAGLGEAGDGGGFAYQGKAGVVFGGRPSRGVVLEGRVLGIKDAVNGAVTVGYRFGF